MATVVQANRAQRVVEGLFKRLGPGWLYNHYPIGSRILFAAVQEAPPGQRFLVDGRPTKHLVFPGPTNDQLRVILSTTVEDHEAIELLHKLVIEKKDVLAGRGRTAHGPNQDEMEKLIAQKVAEGVAAALKPYDHLFQQADRFAQRVSQSPEGEAAPPTAEKPAPTGLRHKRAPRGFRKKERETEIAMWKERCLILGLEDPPINAQGYVNRTWRRNAEQLWADHLASEPQTAS